MPAPAVPLPSLVVHCDWSAGPSKRWMAIAMLQSGRRYLAHAPLRVPDPVEHLLPGLREAASTAAGRGNILAGFDFPIGLPITYARTAGIKSFIEILPLLGSSEWSSFFLPAAHPTEISIQRPFYPSKAGSARQAHQTARLGVSKMDDLRRRCDLSHSGRRAACPIFWTMGASQVGKAAISGWREVLQPALAAGSTAVWPFSGELGELLQSPVEIVVAETYPAEYYGHLGIQFKRRTGGKRSPHARQANASVLVEWAGRAGVELEGGLLESILSGFGSSLWSEDAFDAVTGLLGMLNVILGCRVFEEPEEPFIRQVEGWILGQLPHYESGPISGR